MIFESFDLQKVEKADISSVEDAYTLISDLLDDVYDTAYGAIAVKSNITKTEQPNLFCPVFSDKESRIYYIGNLRDTEEYQAEDVYTVEIKGERIEEIKLYDTDVDFRTLMLTKSGKLTYMKKGNGNVGDLYYDKTFIANNARIGTEDCETSSGALVYGVKPRDFAFSLGELYIYDGKKSTKITDGVDTYQILADGSILYSTYEENSSTDKFVNKKCFIFKDGNNKKVTARKN